MAENNLKTPWIYTYWPGWRAWFKVTIPEEVFEIADPSFRPPEVKPVVKKHTGTKAFMGINAAIALTFGVLTQDPLLAATTFAPGGATGAYTYFNAKKEDKRFAEALRNHNKFIAAEVDHNRVEDRQKNGAGNVCFNEEYANKYIQENKKNSDADKNPGKFSITHWEKDYKGLGYKVIPETLDIFEEMDRLNDLKMERLQAEADAREMTRHDFRRTKEGVIIEDKYSRKQLRLWHGLCRQYLNAADIEKQNYYSLKDDVLATGDAEEAKGRMKKLYNSFDLLFDSGCNFTGFSTRAYEEITDPNEKSFNFPKFWYDLNRARTFRTIKNGSDPCVNEWHKIDDESCLERMDNATSEPIQFYNDDKLDTYHEARKTAKHNVAKFYATKYNTVDAIRNGLMTIAELEDLRGDLSPKEDAKIIEQINNVIDTMADACEQNGYGDRAREIRLAQFGANKPYAEAGSWIPLEEHYGTEYDEYTKNADVVETKPSLWDGIKSKLRLNRNQEQATAPQTPEQ